MCRFGRQVAIFGSILFGLVYLSAGQTLSLQRDYIGIFPITFALMCIPARMVSDVKLNRFALIGFLFGMAAIIKPHLLIALPIVFSTLLAFRWHSKSKSALDFLKCAIVSTISLMVPVSIALIWLIANSALTPFLDIFFNYIPLHTSLTGNHETIFGLDRILYLIRGTLTLGGFEILLLLSLLGYYHIVEGVAPDKATLTSLTCLGFCTLSYAVYPVVAGKFWLYHYMPFAYFCSLSAGLCLFESPQALKPHILLRTKKFILLFAVSITVMVWLSAHNFVSNLDFDLRSGREAHKPNNGRADEIAAWLKINLNPNETVQPLDWTGGGIHAMLLAEASLATHFMYDYHFYHHVSSPYIQKLRRKFMDQLSEASPRFIIDIFTEQDQISGLDTNRKFPELDKLLYYCYTLANTGNGYRIYEKNQKCMTSAPMSYINQ